jgi:hypothetical protein
MEFHITRQLHWFFAHWRICKFLGFPSQGSHY